MYSNVVPFWYYWWIPPKLRVLIKELKAAGFELRKTKGSHRRFVHPGGIKVTVSGKSNADAHRYQILEVRNVIAKVKDEEKRPISEVGLLV